MIIRLLLTKIKTNPLISAILVTNILLLLLIVLNIALIHSIRGIDVRVYSDSSDSTKLSSIASDLNTIHFDVSSINRLLSSKIDQIVSLLERMRYIQSREFLHNQLTAQYYNDLITKADLLNDYEWLIGYLYAFDIDKERIATLEKTKIDLENEIIKSYPNSEEAKDIKSKRFIKK